MFEDFSSEDEAEIPQKKQKVDHQIAKTELYSQSFETSHPAADLVTQSESVNLLHAVKHQVALPDNYNYIPIQKHIPLNPSARIYPFKLDPFQQLAVYSIERNESVLVAAHTSAGKTVVAEYAIATALAKGQRVIYTSPIKALSNQKYREFQAEFGDVGLMTGDVTITPEASCLVMTTEILRSMLYRGSEIMREVSWVVFDEIHYMRDKERGVVWEETLIMLPKQIHFVFLSATIPNAMQFAEWIVKLKEQPCHVVYTDYRPTPLQHYLFPSGADGIYLAVDEKSNFREDNFQKAISSLGDTEPQGDKKGRRGGDKNIAKSNDVKKIVSLIMKKNLHPVIVFSFSKRTCESSAVSLVKLDFNAEDEKALVDAVFKNAIQSLSEDDRKLPQIDHLLPLLKRGIGIHHSGLLPILKEVIEILFQEGLIKVLFATETFSIGLNMPAKTVVFTSVRKFDGKETRWLSGGEYIQMSGRAGRRGLDERGIVILMIDEKMEPQVAKSMLKGESDPLNSAYHLTYTMILNLLRMDGMSAEFMLQSSFFQFQNCARIPELKKLMQDLTIERDAIIIPNEEVVSKYHNLLTQLESYKSDCRKVLNHPTICLPFLQPGRLVHIKTKDGIDYGWGIIVNFQKTYKHSKNDLIAISSPAEGPVYVLDVLLNKEKISDGARSSEKKPKLELVVVPCSLDLIQALSSIRVKMPGEIKSSESRTSLQKVLIEISRRFPEGVPQLDPVKDFEIKDESFIKLLQKIEVVQKKLSIDFAKGEVSNDHYDLFKKKIEINEKLQDYAKQTIQSEAVLQLSELKARRRVLRRMEHISSTDVIQVKGRVACEISSGDSLLLTEMIFNGLFNDLSVAQTCALLSCFVCDERRPDPPTLGPELNDPYKSMQASAKRIAMVSSECKLDIDVSTYLESFRSEMMELVFAWSNGSNFAEICKMSNIFEGSIIRVMRRLDELIKELINAAKAIGNTLLEAKFTEASVSIKRDIVFAASLYL